MSELYTTKQVQELLQVDRTTVYRMLNDGRLTGVKVGSHWRFQKAEIDRLLSGGDQYEDPDLSSMEILPIHCVQSIQNVFGQIAEVGAVVTDLDGNPLTEMSHCSEFCALIQDSPSGYQACLDSWRELAEDPASKPVFHQCHARLQYARGFIAVKNQPAAMIIAGQFYLDEPESEDREQFIRELADKYEIDSSELLEAAAEIPVLDDRTEAKIGSWISEVARTFGDISTERAEMLERLRAISEMSSID
ncbi:MAG: PocR ligand-binding domain-containing protein [Anaerolineales bacterium]